MRAVFACFLLFLVACPGRHYPPEIYRAQPDPRNKELVLGVSDVVSINVWEQKDLNTEATIRPDGTITMPLVGDLKAAGETPSSLKETIKKRLQDFVKLQTGSEITVAVKAWHSYKFRISGEVSKEGVYTADDYITVADALAMAGGVTRFAKRNEIVLLRTNPQTKKQVQIPLDYDLLASGKRPDMNIWVLSGDQIFVP